MSPRRKFVVETKQRPGLFRKSPEALLIEAEGAEAAPPPERCPLREDALRAFRAYRSAQPEEARALAAVWASANLPALVNNKTAKRDADAVFRERAA